MIWFCNLPIWLSFLLIASLFLGATLGIFYLVKPLVNKWYEGQETNDQISFFLSAIGVFYGITLALLTAGVWENYQATEGKVVEESSAIAAFYRDISYLPQEVKIKVQKHTKDYTKFIFSNLWAKAINGQTDTSGIFYLDSIQASLYQFQPQNFQQMALYQEAVDQFNKLVELRRQRMADFNVGMHWIIWAIIFGGAFVTLFMSCMFKVASPKLHLVLLLFMSFMVSSLIYITILLDHPFHGDTAILPTPYEQVYMQLMLK